MSQLHHGFSIITMSCCIIGLIALSKGEDTEAAVGCLPNKKCDRGDLCHPVYGRCVPCDCFCNEPQNKEYCAINLCQPPENACHRQTEYYDQVTATCQKCLSICGDGKKATKELCDRMCSERKCCPESEFRNPHNGTCDHCSTVCGPDDDPVFCFNFCRVYKTEHGDGPVAQVTRATSHDEIPLLTGTVTRYDGDLDKIEQTTSVQSSQLSLGLVIALLVVVGALIGLVLAICIFHRRKSKKKDQTQNIELDERQPAAHERLLQQQPVGISTQNSNQYQQEPQLLPPEVQEISEEPYNLDLRSEVNDDLASERSRPNNENSLSSDITNNTNNQNSYLIPVRVTSLGSGIQYREPICTDDGLESTVSDKTAIKELRT